VTVTRLRDFIHIFSALNCRRLFNAMRLYASFYLSRIFRKSFHWGMPMSLSIEPTTTCNLRCPQCPSGLRSFSRPTGNLDTDFFEKILNQTGRNLFSMILYFQGEPLINPDFFKLIRSASARGIYTMTSTNGHFFSSKNINDFLDSGLDRLIISIDGTTQETYEQYRIRGKLSKVVEGTRQLVYRRQEKKVKKPYIIFQFLILGTNEHQMAEVVKLGKEIGVDKVTFKTAQIYDPRKSDYLLPASSKFSRYKKEKNRYLIKSKLRNHCWRMWSSAVITWNGLVVPCCFDKDATYRMGDLEHADFKSIWTGQAYRNFRKQILNNRQKIDVCSNCSEGSKVFI